MAHTTERRRGAFIDRDGVINEEWGFVHRPEDFALLPGALPALRDLQSAGYVLVVITNQSGIARGLYTEQHFFELRDHLVRTALQAGVRLDAVQYCPHLPDAPLAQYRVDCDCRKPRSGMITQAAAALDLDLKQSILIGDRGSDVAAGRGAGVQSCYLVRTGSPLLESDVRAADGVFDDLQACVRFILDSNRPIVHVDST